jgi:hypothetical protein
MRIVNIVSLNTRMPHLVVLLLHSFPPSAPVAVLSAREATSVQYGKHSEFDFLWKCPFLEAGHEWISKSLKRKTRKE